MDAETRPAGVMDAGYARGRTTKPALLFRLRTRAHTVVLAVRRFRPVSAVRLLEIGAAEGRTLVEMAAAMGEGEYIGVEYDKGLRKAHGELPSNVRLIGGDAMSLPVECEDSSFDVVSMLAVLEHLTDPSKAMREALRVLKPGGLLVATCPNPFWDTVATRLRLVDDSLHVQKLDLARMRALAVSNGFEIVAARRFMWAPMAVLPYFHIPVSPKLALGIDRLIDRLPGVRCLCVNGYLIARRPEQRVRSATD